VVRIENHILDSLVVRRFGVPTVAIAAYDPVANLWQVFHLEFLPVADLVCD
jgi:hypothetical protein